MVSIVSPKCFVKQSKLRALVFLVSVLACASVMTGNVHHVAVSTDEKGMFCNGQLAECPIIDSASGIRPLKPAEIEFYWQKVNELEPDCATEHTNRKQCHESKK